MEERLLVLDRGNHPVSFPVKRTLNDLSIPNLYEHVPCTAGLREDDYLARVERLTTQATSALDILLNFMQSNDPQLLIKSQLPLAHNILNNLLNVVVLKRNELKPANQMEPLPPVKVRRIHEDNSLPVPSMQQILFPFQPPPSLLPSFLSPNNNNNSNIPPIRLLNASAPGLLRYDNNNVNINTNNNNYSNNNNNYNNIVNLLSPYVALSSTNNLAIGTGNNMEWGKTPITDFELLGELGNGAFGSVRLCKHKAINALYCIKILDRKKVVYLKQREHILNERTIMFSVNHPFIVKLFSTYKSPSCLFFVMEFVAGGELFNYIRAEGQFTNRTAQLCAAEIIVTLQYLHNQDIIYRDIKPENLLVDHEGHLKLTDFGFAKHIEDRTMSMCGTLDYMAPEILMAKGHGKPADWWSLGVLLFELLSGCPPFTPDKDGSHVSNLISSGQLEFPPCFDARAVDLIKRLLMVDPKERLGSNEGAEELKRHPWFSDIDWAKIVKKEYMGPMMGLKSFKLHFGKPVLENQQFLLEEMVKAEASSRNPSFEGFGGFRTAR